MNGCYLDHYSPCEQCGKCGWVEKEQEEEPQEEIIQKGDKVKMNDKYWVSDHNKGKVFEVVSDPWKVCGSDCVLLDGFKGCYAVDGLTKVK